MLSVSTDQLEIAFKRSNTDTPYKKVLLTDLSVEQVIRFKEQENNLYGAQIDIGLIRNYPYKSLAAHALGYTQLITQNEFSKLSERGYKLSDRIGRKGIEAAFESELRGAWGGEMLEIDSLGTVQRSLGLKLPQAGSDIKLTLDLDGIDIGESFKISSVKLENDVVPTIQGRDFVIATLAAPTVIKEPEKPAEAEAADGEAATEDGASTEGEKPAAEGDKKEGEDKKPAEEKK